MDGRHTRGPGRPPQTSVEDILTAAEAVGLKQLTRAAVAKRLGVSTATIRHHVESSSRLYSLACDRVFARLDVHGGSGTDWTEYLRLVAARFARLLGEQPGLRDYVLFGPYEPATLDRFDRIMAELIDRDERLDRATAYMLGSRTLVIAAAMRAPDSESPTAQVHPQASTQRGDVWTWTLDAFFRGADTLIAAGSVPDVIPVPDAPWSSVNEID
ncbi:AcrR family transcriptional regulator [Rhodococcus sp. 27YEA15]|uniref:TetR/AcrR family transcriptional regulator n=1 Tax=Rhodococcus sp. 27YEA15 TaxID=3156259 RepID=UPI003C7E95AE